MPDGFAPFGKLKDLAVSGLQMASDAASGARYLLAPNESERAGDALRGDNKPAIYPGGWNEAAGARTFDRMKAGSGSSNDIWDPTHGQSRAQIDAEKNAVEGPKIGPRPFGLQVRDALEEIRPLPLVGSLADLIGGDTDASAQRNPYDNQDWDDMPDPTMGMTRIGVGEAPAVRKALRQNLVESGLERARSLFAKDPHIVKGFERIAETHPRTFAHTVPGREVMVGNIAEFAPIQHPTKVGSINLHPSTVPTAEDAASSAAHELTHGAQAIAEGGLGKYQALSKEHGYWNNPHEVSARTSERFQPVWAEQRAKQAMLPGSRPVMQSLARNDAQLAGVVGQEMRALQKASPKRQKFAQRRPKQGALDFGDEAFGPDDADMQAAIDSLMRSLK